MNKSLLRFYDAKYKNYVFKVISKSAEVNLFLIRSERCCKERSITHVTTVFVIY